ncbi:flocculation protein FLO11-like isoform X2 [Octopus sinensis]|nr:flocculation protein FLO11-like isoform X2 [Octopus sinensis]XP_036366611.1 flocculation protein FLO11-like isoform X2 [Octopus sinensis]XP_036366612.1 flocculation protein FLO11-like isoform X2 [Octopus sinensis]
MCDNGVEVQTEEIHSLRQELDNIKSQRDRLTDLIKTAGISSLLNSSWKGRKVDSTSNSSDSRPESADTTSNVLQASSKKDKDTEGATKSSKSKRPNTIHSQLESIANKKQIAKLAQETITKMNSGSILMPSLNNFNGMQATNILPAGINQQQIFAAAPNLLNTSLSNAILASNAQGQVIFSNANSAGSFVNLQGSSTQPSVAFVSPSSNLLANNSEKGNSDGSGLLQIAMRDAGITSVTQSFITPPQLPQITSQAQQAMISSIASTNAETMISADSSQGQQPTPQQTLASVVSNNQCINTGFMNSSFFSGNNCFQQGSNTITNTTQAINTQVPIMSIGQSNYNQILQNGNALINVPIMNAANQSLPVGGALPGIGGIQGLQTGQGQIVLVNDHSGLSLMPNYQMVVDPTTLALTNNSRQFSNDKVATQKLGHAVDQTKMALTNVINNTEVLNHAATLPVQNQQQATQQGITLQNTINAQALASNQAPAMQQLAFQPAQQTISLGATNSVIQQAQMNNQLSAQQQQMLSAPYASANTNFLNPNPGLVLPVSQNGNLLTLNTVPSQPNQLPTALILPNGHIIPVVTQPQVLLQQQLQQQQIQQQLLNANCQLQAAVAAQTQAIHPSQIPAKLAVVGNLGNNNIPIIDSNLTTILNPPNVQCQNQSALVQSQQKPPMGLLMTTTISNFPVSNAATTVASINNNMVTTSATQSVMTTQVQASQMHRPTSAPAFVKRSETQTSDSKGVVMSTTTGSLMQFRTSNTSTPDNSILLGNVSQTNLQTAVGTVPSQTDSSVTSSLPTNLQSSLPVNQSGQTNGPNGTILITFGPPGGQQTCCILNPNSMQGLGNISNQQPSLPAISTIPTTISSTNPTVSSKKNNKKNSQRTIVPKPPKANQTNPLPSVCSMNSSNSVSSTQVSVSSTLWNTTPLSSDQEASSTTMQNVVSTNDICVSTTAESTIIQSPSTSNTSENTGTTDILAKAAESIFSSSLQDISPPISSFYNPANEDNPLHIDTSAGETEDDCSAQSPSKESCDSDHIPTSSRIEMEVETQSTHSLDNACSNLTVSSPSTSTFFKESDICESIGAVSKRGNLKSKIIEPEKEKMKKDFKKLPDSKKLTKSQFP